MTENEGGNFFEGLVNKAKDLGDQIKDFTEHSTAVNEQSAPPPVVRRPKCLVKADEHDEYEEPIEESAPDRVACRYNEVLVPPLDGSLHDVRRGAGDKAREVPQAELSERPELAGECGRFDVARDVLQEPGELPQRARRLALELVGREPRKLPKQSRHGSLERSERPVERRVVGRPRERRCDVSDGALDPVGWRRRAIASRDRVD